MNLLLVLLLAAPQDFEIREELIQLTALGCGEEMPARAKRLAKISNAALEELPAMIKESDGDRRLSLMHLYGQIAHWKTIPRTPAVLVNLARGGTEQENLRAAALVLKIRDERATAFLIEGLSRIVADERTLSFALDRCMLMSAGGYRSAEVGKLLLALIDYPNTSTRWLILESLGSMGFAPALPRLKELAGDKDKMIASGAKHAIEKLEVLSSPDPAASLVERVRGMKMWGECSWYRWALDWIVHLKLTGAAGEIRLIYDELVKKNRVSGADMAWPTTMLHAIQELGGKLSAEETTLLTDLGRLPPAKLSDAGEEKLVEGFDKSVWAPRAQRLKELEARNAPPPRIPEEKLPKFMKERIAFVMNLAPAADPSYLAPNAVLALETIEEMLPAEFDPAQREKLLDACLYLARLREGMKTPDSMFRLAEGPPMNRKAALIVTTIADDRAEKWYLQQMEGPNARIFAGMSGRLAGPKVKEALLDYFRNGDRHARFDTLRALADMGCIEILPELKAEKTNPQNLRQTIELLEWLAAPDRDKKLLAIAKSGARNTDFSYAYWARDQIVRLNLKELGPELRKWFDEAKVKWVTPTPDGALVQMILALSKLGMPITPEEEQILKQNGRRP